MEEAKLDVLFCFNPNNSIFGGREEADKHSKTLVDITIWSGFIANCGESSLSSIVLKSCDTLTRFTYFPYRTKGGSMVRPLYCRGDRAGKVVFSNLQYLAMPCHVIMWTHSLAPCGWITPSLKELSLIVPHTEIRYDRILKNIQLIKDEASLHTENPTLKTINITSGNFDDPTATQTCLVKIECPVYLSTEIISLLLLVMTKERSTSCRLAALPKDIIRYIFNMLHSSWQVDYSKLNEICENI